MKTDKIQIRIILRPVDDGVDYPQPLIMNSEITGEVFDKYFDKCLVIAQDQVDIMLNRLKKETNDKSRTS